jgi:DNA repair protein RadD
MTAMSNLFNNPQPAKPVELYYYQQEAIDACYGFLRTRKDNPCIVIPTGGGKTPLMATICNDAVTRWNGRVLVLSHVKELVSQTAETLGSWYPKLKVGVYSAGLGRRESRADVLVAGIQSVYKKGLKLAGSDPFRLVLVDESHRIPTSGDGMYRQLLTDLQVAFPGVRVVGLTATPYRLKGGSVCGPENFLNEICYEAGVRELIAKGYLCRLTSKQSRHSVDSTKLAIKNGEFDSDALSLAFDTDGIVNQAVGEILHETRNRKSVLIFCCNVAHAEHVQQLIESQAGQQVGLITGETADSIRDQEIRQFKNGEIKFLTSVNCLTEGFDARRVDCVVLLRSTLSPGLYYQMVGRGLRLHETKSDCLILDFGGNVMRHGCIDAIKVQGDKAKGGSGAEAAAKECPECESMVPVVYKTCPECGFPWPIEERKPNHQPTADAVAVTTDQLKPSVWNVNRVYYCQHEKRGFKEGDLRTMRVSYYQDRVLVAEEWVCVEHSGWANERALAWWNERTLAPMPDTAHEAAKLATLGYLAEPTQIEIVKPPGEKFSRITKYWLGPKVDPDEVLIEVDEWGAEVRAGSVVSDEEIPF